MASRLIADRAGLFTCELDVNGPVLGRALDHPAAEELLHGALILVLAGLTHDGRWPARTRRVLTELMLEMREEVRRGAAC